MARLDATPAIPPDVESTREDSGEMVNRTKTAISLTATALALTLLPLAAASLAQAKPEAVDAAALYKKQCLMCHGANGDSKLPGMSFVDGEWKHGTSVKEMAVVIRDGVKGTAMLPFKNKLNDAEVEALAKYIRAFDKALK